VSGRDDAAIRVLVADDHPLFRRAVVQAVERRAELTLVGAHSDGEGALAALRELRPDVALLDVRMPGLTGIEVLEAAAKEELPTRIVLLSGYPDPDAVYRAVAAGAAGFLVKSESGSEICERIVAASRGETVLSPDVQTELAGQLRTKAQPGAPVLSPRERQILELIAAGELAPEIARHLGLSPATVRTHLQHLYEKLGVSDRAAAVAAAMRRGMLD
jgi:two-component system, NarL family, nitrate/nitrite response regulator NarL